MNKLESFVYGMVKNNYVVKNALRNIYQGIYDLMPNYASWFKSEPSVRGGYFFGFHDVSPFASDNNKMLANKLLIPLRMPNAEDVLEVGYFSGKKLECWHKIGETKAWNYHKGCRLQWVGENACIYNVATGNVVQSCLVDLRDNSSSLIDWPIDSVSPTGTIASSFSYERLQKEMPGYGYVYHDNDSFLNENIPSKTGLFLVNVKENTRMLLLSLSDIAAYQHEDGMDGAFHFVTHTEFSRDGKYVSFLHRWYKGTFQKTRLIVCRMEDRMLWCSPTSGMVSHYVWNGIGGIVAYCRVEDIDSHVYFSDHTMREWKRCGYPKLNSDGHHSFIDDHTFVVDTYPDKRRHAKIYKVNINNSEVELLVDCRSFKRFASPTLQKHWACDLHPRCSHDGSLLSFDSVFTGERALCVMPLQRV